MTDILIAEARHHEAAFLSNLAEAQDEYEWIVEHEAWVELGHDSFADWWQEQILPQMRALNMRPTREIAAKVVEQVRAEEIELPPAQRRTQREIGELAGISDDTVARITGSRSAPSASAARADLDSSSVLMSDAMRHAVARAEERAADRDEIREINANTSPELLAWAREREWWIGQGTRLARACRLLLDEVTAEPGQLLDELPDNVRSDLSVLPAAHDLLTRLRKEMEARS